MYTLTAVMKVKKDVIDSIAESPVGRAVGLVIKYVKTFKTNVLVFICILYVLYVTIFSIRFSVGAVGLY